MATDEVEAPTAESLEQHKVDDSKGEQVSGATETAEDPDFRLESEQDEAMAGEQDTSETTNDVGEEMEAEKETSTALGYREPPGNEPSTLEDSVGDLFDDCGAMETTAETPEDVEKEEKRSEQAVKPADSGSQQQPSDQTVSEAMETSDETRGESEAPDASMKDANALLPGSTTVTTESATTSTVEAPSEPEPTADSNPTSAKRAAASPTPSLPAFSWNDILRVQNLIERCLQQYLTKREILDALQAQASVDPSFADVVWQKLEEQNPSFFRAYHVQLRLKEQIVAFNYLVTQQKAMSAKRGKRRHVRTSATSDPRSSKRRGSASTSVFTPLTSDSLFPTAVDDSEASHGGGRMSASTANSLIAQLPPPSPLPLPSPIKTELDTHAFFT